MPHKSKKYICDIERLLDDWDWENNTISPYNTPIGSTDECFWKCVACGYVWKTKVRSRGYTDHGCPACSRKKASDSKRKTHAVRNNFFEKFPDIAKEWHQVKNWEYDIHEVSAYSNINVWWKCSVCGHEWKTTVNHRTKEDNGCPVCSRMRGSDAKSRTHSIRNNFLEYFADVAEEWHPDRNGSLLPSDVSVSSNKIVWWKCSFCGNEWQTSVSHRAHGQNCSRCNKYQTSFPEQAIFHYVSKVYPDALSRKKIEGTEFDIYIPSKKIAIEYDGVRFHKKEINQTRDNNKDAFCASQGITLFRFRDKLLPDTDSAIRITCNENSIDAGIRELLNKITENHNVLVDTANDRSKIIKNIRQLTMGNSILVLKPELLMEWNQPKNGNLLPQSVAASANYKVWWKCSKCDYEWQATPSHRFNGRGCPACAGKVCRTGYNDLLTKNPKIAQEWHYEKNFPLKPENIVVRSNKKVWWKCSKGHEWETTVSERNRGSRSTNCPYCANKKVLAGFNDLETTHSEIAKEWHPTRNGKVKASMVTAGSGKSVWWLCDCGYEWKTTIYLRKKGNNCPRCKKK